MSQEQCGFRNGLGTREALFSIQILVQRCRDINQKVYLCFIDFVKAFDKVRHEKLIEVLRKIGIDGKDLQFITNLYWHQQAKIRRNHTLSNDFRIRRGVRQGCILSPIFFNLYSEEIMSEALEDTEEGIIINGKVINNLRYADDTVLIAGSIEDLQKILNKVVTASENLGLNLNAQKTKYMVIDKEQIPTNVLRLKNVPLDKGKIVGKRSHGRPQITWLDNLRKWFNTSTISLFRTAINKDQIANMITNVR
ncbi:hypothetical protein QTP88_019882 [Uroleucon formosanum]